MTVHVQTLALNPSPVRKYAVMLDGHSTSVSLEEDFWRELSDIAARERMTLNRLVTGIDAMRVHMNLSSALRLYVLRDMKSRVSALVAQVRQSAA